MEKENKCEKEGLVHAWINNNNGGFGLNAVYLDFNSSTCGNCGLNRTRHTQTKEWYSYSDGRPDEPINNAIPV